ncbi:MAG: YdeI/OmpD-associated family protein [Gemmatimonadaceae bacterium]
MTPAKTSAPDLPVKLFKTQAAWDTWLSKNGDNSPGVWMRLAKKAARLTSISYPEAVESGLCHGWIDGLKKSFDDESWLQRFTPRKAASVWSKINRTKALELIEGGRMQPAGLATIERAQANGRWEAAYDPQSSAQPSPEFQRALDANPHAKKYFDGLGSRQRYPFIVRIQMTANAAARAKKIEKFIAMLAQRQTLG